MKLLKSLTILMGIMIILGLVFIAFLIGKKTISSANNTSFVVTVPNHPAHISMSDHCIGLYFKESQEFWIVERSKGEVLQKVRLSIQK